MQRDSRKRGPPGAAFTGALALVLVICLVECASGSCLSYGHSCWGAHGKRSGKAVAPMWLINKLLRNMDNNEQVRPPQAMKGDDLNTIFQEASDDTSGSVKLGSEVEESPSDLVFSRDPVAKPMLDDDLLAKMKLWQLMKGVSDKK